jgi:hypothetical protein
MATLYWKFLLRWKWLLSGRWQFSECMTRVSPFVCDFRIPSSLSEDVLINSISRRTYIFERLLIKWGTFFEDEKRYVIKSRWWKVEISQLPWQFTLLDSSIVTQVSGSRNFADSSTGHEIPWVNMIKIMNESSETQPEQVFIAFMSWIWDYCRQRLSK